MARFPVGYSVPLFWNPMMLYLATCLCLMPVFDQADPRDERIRTFLKRDDDKIDACEQYLWSNPNRQVTLNDIMMIYKKQYALDIAVNYTAFRDLGRNLAVSHPVKKVVAIDSVIPRGLALQFYLDNFQDDVTYVVDNGTIWIVPGRGTLPDATKTNDLGTSLRTLKPKYENQLNKEATNRQELPPSDLLSALYFFGQKNRGDFRVFLRDRELPRGLASRRIKVPEYADLSYDVIMTRLLDQVNAKYIVYGDHSIVIVPK